jgi:hypothetical protein
MTPHKIDQAFIDELIERAISIYADVYFDSDVQQMKQAMHQAQCQYCNLVTTYLVSQVSQYLGQVDTSIQAVYKLEPISANQIIQRDAPPPIAGRVGIHLVIWVVHTSQQLQDLVDSLNIFLAASLPKLICPGASPTCSSITIEIVDDTQVRNQSGYGLAVPNTYIHSKPVWEKTGIQELRPVEEAPAAQSNEFVEYGRFDPEKVPEIRVLEHIRSIERIPLEDRVMMEPHLTELKVILIRRMVSEHLTYVGLAKKWFTTADLAYIYEHKIGSGRIGGKAAGLLLAERIFKQVADEDFLANVMIPESYFLGTEVINLFLSMNGLTYWNDQKYKSEDQMLEEYPFILEEFQMGKFPPEIVSALEELLIKFGSRPLIVRSSSQLEDSFGTSFAGKYDSHFCPNQGTPEENLDALTNAIALTYASAFKPEALRYRRSIGLQDYAERMSILIQAVEGEPLGQYLLPHASGVAHSRNIFRWSPQIKPELGFARIVWGLGTRAVERLGDDYPRLVALSHPTLQPNDSAQAIRHYSQRQVDLIDKKTNALVTMPIHEVLTPDYPPLNLITQLERDGYFVTARQRVRSSEIPRLAVNFHEFLARTNFTTLLSKMLRLLEEHYHSTVDLEFAVNIPEPRNPRPTVQITLLQCRPQSYLEGLLPPALPEDLAEEHIIFSSGWLVPRGYLSDIRYLVYVKPLTYFALDTQAARRLVGQAISHLNEQLDKRSFICIGPGRWGSTNPDLGVYVSYADIHHSGAMIELSGSEAGAPSEPSLGTHFFHDLMEAQIYPIAVPLDEPDTRFQREFFDNAPNVIKDLITVNEQIAQCIQVIDIAAYRPGHHIEMIMDNAQEQVTAFLVKKGD